MGYIVKMPQMGMSMDEGTVVEWTLNEGDGVEAEEVVAVVESEKASADVEARESGILRRIVVDEGGDVAPGTAIGIIAEADEDLAEYESRIDADATGGSRSDADSRGAPSDSGPDESADTTGAPDGDVTVVARPEAFDANGGPVEATIETRSYLGEHVRATARTPDESTFSVPGNGS